MKRLIVIFQATRQETESLALGLGLGAVQGGADIRFRHLAPSPEIELQHREYGRLKTGDLEWAECLAIVLEPGQIAGLEELFHAFPLAPGGCSDPPKLAIVVGENPESEAVLSVQEQISSLGMRLLREETIVRPLTVEHMTRLGNQLASLPHTRS